MPLDITLFKHFHVYRLEESMDEKQRRIWLLQNTITKLETVLKKPGSLVPHPHQQTFRPWRTAPLRYDLLTYTEGWNDTARCSTVGGGGEDAEGSWRLRRDLCGDQVGRKGT